MLRQAMDIAIGAHLKPLGYHMELGNASFTPDTFTIKVTINREKASGEVGDAYSREWLKHWRTGVNSAGLKVGMLTQVYSKQYRFRGLKPRARVRPYIMEDTRSGRLYRFTSVSNFQFVDPAT